MTKSAKSLTIAWMYPRYMSTYGDRGNVIILKKRCEWRDISVSVVEFDTDTPLSKLKTSDLIFMGGAQDIQQEIVSDDLFSRCRSVLHEKTEHFTPLLAVCGGYQFLGKYYIAADGTRVKGLDLLPLYTERAKPGEKRLTGNIVVKPLVESLDEDAFLVGFENHGGRTYLKKDTGAFGKVVVGFGNNGEDGLEGVFYKHVIGTYFHGPVLSKSPEFADWLIAKALEKKYQDSFALDPLDDALHFTARRRLVKQWYGK